MSSWVTVKKSKAKKKITKLFLVSRVNKTIAHKEVSDMKKIC